MKSILNFEKISNLYLQQKVDDFAKIVQDCLEKQHLLKNSQIYLGVLCPNTKDCVSLIRCFDTESYFVNYKDFSYIRDGYCFYFTIGNDILTDRRTTNILVKKDNKDNRKNGIYIYLNKELKEVLVCSL